MELVRQEMGLVEDMDPLEKIEEDMCPLDEEDIGPLEQIEEEGISSIELIAEDVGRVQLTEGGLGPVNIQEVGTSLRKAHDKG